MRPFDCVAMMSTSRHAGVSVRYNMHSEHTHTGVEALGVNSHPTRGHVVVAKSIQRWAARIRGCNGGDSRGGSRQCVECVRQRVHQREHVCVCVGVCVSVCGRVHCMLV